MRSVQPSTKTCLAEDEPGSNGQRRAVCGCTLVETAEDGEEGDTERREAFLFPHIWSFRANQLGCKTKFQLAIRKVD